ncbi:MAG: acyl-CoA dehydrogenase [Chromatiales bacterium]|nr:acyl-CoA dehydrogenase [Chromatiales bacterium]
MDFTLDESTREICDAVETFFETQILPRASDWEREVEQNGNSDPKFLQDLRASAFDAGLWNLALPRLAPDEPGTCLSNIAFAAVAEVLGRLSWASQVFNCQAPDVPNMEILQMFATPEQKAQFLMPLLLGETRSSFSMTEPAVASSDATNIATRIDREGDHYVINGHKWFASGASNPRCSFMIVVGVTDANATRGQRHSMVIVPTDAPGVTMIRNLPVLHHVDTMTPHTELKFENVRVPVTNRLGEEGGGFLIGQARLGPARVHHCMRAIGKCEVLLGLMTERAAKRTTFGQKLADYSSVQDAIAESRLDIEQARLLVQRTAWRLDEEGNQAVRQDVSLIKIAVARAYHNIADRGVQLFGAMGLTSDTPFAAALAQARAFRIYDGPDEVHLRTVYRLEERQRRGENLSARYMP